MRTHRSRHPLPLLTLSFVLSSVWGACTPSSNVPPPPASTPVLVPLTPTDPTGTPAPANAPLMYTTILKFSIPSRTVFEVASEGWMLQENTVAPCGNDGCYEVLARNDDGSGTTTYVIQVWPQAHRRFGNRTEFQITDVSLNSTFSGAQSASPPLRLIVSPGVGQVLGGVPNPAGVPGTHEWAANNEVDALRFRTIPLSTAQEAQAYYDAIDPPPGRRRTLAEWRQVNGFSPTDDSQDDAKAVYFNAGDLNLGRSMHLHTNKQTGDIAYYVSNYPTVADAIRGTNLIATVAMEYSPGPQGGQQFMKFFVYNGNNVLAPDAALDRNGFKFVPNLCTTCHGVRAYTTTNVPEDVGARFLPFDLRSYQYDPTQSRANQEAAFRRLNLDILKSNYSAAERALLFEWYKDPAQTPSDTARQTQNDDAIPGVWTGHEQLYLEVVRPSCRSCHVSRNAALAFANFADFDSYGPRAFTEVCLLRDMPAAIVNYEKFWLEHLAQPARSQVGVLNLSGVTGWNSANACPQ